jgi:hypothetical protein
MAKRVGTWWIKGGMDERRKEAQGFGDVLSGLPSFNWTQDHGDSGVLKKDFVETASYTEKVDEVDLMYMCSHGNYTDGVSSTYGKAFSVWNNTVRSSDTIDWGKSDLEYFSSHACRLLYHSSSNSVGRWMAAFQRLHYMFGFHTVSHSGKNQDDRGKKFGLYAAWHLFFPDGLPMFPSSYSIRKAWKKACIETEGSSVKWAYLRANGETSGGTWVNTYDERLETTEPNDPEKNRDFYTAKGSC